MTSHDPAGPAVPPGALAGRYQLGEVLGRGGMAIVHRAHDELLDRPVAVKLLRDTVDERDRDRFLGEVRLLAGLSHPGVVTVLDAGTSGAQPFLVMELVEGPTLASVLRDGALPLGEVTAIGTQLAAALAYAHALGVVHRDVKPANVLLGPDGRVKLADFGIARVIGDTVRHTRTGTLIGTAAYLAPEQVRGQAVGPPADVYSLGLVLLEAITGERAFPGSQTETALARLHRAPAVPPSLPAAWGALLVDMTALDPADRPPAADVADRLRAVGDQPGVAPAAPPRSGGTLVMPTAPPPPPPPAPRAAGHPPVVEAARRAAGDLAGGARAGATKARQWWRGVPESYRGAGIALALMVLLIVALAVVAGTSGEEPDRAPEDTPSELRDPLQDLHDAVHGEGS